MRLVYRCVPAEPAYTIESVTLALSNTHRTEHHAIDWIVRALFAPASQLIFCDAFADRERGTKAQILQIVTVQ